MTGLVQFSFLIKDGVTPEGAGRVIVGVENEIYLGMRRVRLTQGTVPVLAQTRQEVVVDGIHCRIRSSARSSKHAPPHPPNDDDCGGDHYAVAGADYWGGCGRVAGDCYGAMIGKSGNGIRCKASGEGAGAESGCEICG